MSILQFFIIFAILTIAVEMCGNVRMSSGGGGSSSTVDLATSQTFETVTDKGAADFTQVKTAVGNYFEELLSGAETELINVDDKATLRYTFKNVGCKDVKPFAKVIKNTASLASLAETITVNCDGKKSTV